MLCVRMKKDIANALCDATEKCNKRRYWQDNLQNEEQSQHTDDTRRSAQEWDCDTHSIIPLDTTHRRRAWNRCGAMWSLPRQRGCNAITIDRCGVTATRWSSPIFPNYSSVCLSVSFCLRGVDALLQSCHYYRLVLEAVEEKLDWNWSSKLLRDIVLKQATHPLTETLTRCQPSTPS